MSHRVLHVMATPHGGSALSTVALIEGLAERGVESSVACMAMSRTVDAERRRVDEDRITDAVSGRAVFVPLYRWNRRIRAPWWQRPAMNAAQVTLTGLGHRTRRRLIDFARDQQASLVHTSSLVTPDGHVVSQYLHLPHVWHVREMVGPGEPFRFYGEGRRFARRLTPSPSTFVATSHAAARCFGTVAPGIDVDVVHNGLDLSGLLALATPPVREPVVVGMIANLSARWKRHDLFIRAAALASRHVEARFVLIGAIDDRDPYTRDLRGLVDELGIGDRVEFLGRRPTAESALDEIDFLVHVADSESFGRVIVEAMAGGRAVVGVDAGGVGELVDDGDTGLLVPAGDPGAIADAIVRLVASPDLRRRLGERGRVIAADRYSAEAMTRAMLEIYARAQAPSPPRNCVGNRSDLSGYLRNLGWWGRVRVVVGRLK